MLNRLPKRPLGWKIPLRLWQGDDVDLRLSDVPPWGSQAFLRLPHPDGKLGDRAVECWWVGLPLRRQSAHRLVQPVTFKAYEHNDVRINKGEKVSWRATDDPGEDPGIIVLSAESAAIPSESNYSESVVPSGQSTSSELSGSPSPPRISGVGQQTALVNRTAHPVLDSVARSGRIRRLPARLNDQYDFTAAGHAAIDTSLSTWLDAAFSCLDSEDVTTTADALQSINFELSSLSSGHHFLHAGTTEHAFGSLELPVHESDTPTLGKALKGPNSLQWRIAIEEELGRLTSMDAWDVVDWNSTAMTEHRKHHSLLPSVVTLKIKRDERGSPIRFKARFCAGGHRQRDGEFGETDAPVVSMQAIRTLCALSAAQLAQGKRVVLRQFDFVSAYLNASLPTNEYVYVKQLEGFEKRPEGMSKPVLKLKRALYGLRQSALAWFQHIRDHLHQLGFRSTKAEPCVMIHDQLDVTIGLYVDDLLAFGDPAGVDKLQALLEKSYDLTGGHELHWALGIKFHVEGHRITMGQEQYARTILARLGVTDDSKNYPIPLSTAHRCAQPVAGAVSQQQHNWYRSALGSVMYLATSTRPDITFAVHTLAKMASAPRVDDITAMQKLLRYIQGTLNFTLVFDGAEGHGLRLQVPGYKKEKRKGPAIQLYADADHATSWEHDAKSTSGYTAFVGGNLVDWTSKKQTLTAKSTAEAEYAAISEACVRGINLRSLLEDLGYTQGLTPLMTDSEAAEAIITSAMVKQRSKHFAIRYHLARDFANPSSAHQEFELYHVSSAEQLADGLTKALGRQLFPLWLRKLLPYLESNAATAHVTSGNET